MLKLIERTTNINKIQALLLQLWNPSNSTQRLRIGMAPLSISATIETTRGRGVWMCGEWPRKNNWLCPVWRVKQFALSCVCTIVLKWISRCDRMLSPLANSPCPSCRFSLFIEAKNCIQNMHVCCSMSAAAATNVAWHLGIRLYLR
jgi:hypothetical protein